jgi:hypothetical protein
MHRLCHRQVPSDEFGRMHGLRSGQVRSVDRPHQLLPLPVGQVPGQEEVRAVPRVHSGHMDIRRGGSDGVLCDPDAGADCGTDGHTDARAHCRAHTGLCSWHLQGCRFLCVHALCRRPVLRSVQHR